MYKFCCFILNLKKHVEAKLCLPLQTAYCRLVFPCFTGVYLCVRVQYCKGRHLSIMLVDQLQTTRCEILLLYVVQESWLWTSIYSFLDYKYSFFNAIVSGLTALNRLKIFGLCPQKLSGLLLRPQLQLWSPLFSL